MEHQVIALCVQLWQQQWELEILLVLQVLLHLEVLVQYFGCGYVLCWAWLLN